MVLRRKKKTSRGPGLKPGKDRILDAAERLFARREPEAASTAGRRVPKRR